MSGTGRTFDPREVEFFLTASKLSTHDELVYRLALAGLSPRCRAHGPFRQRLDQLMADVGEYELAKATSEARDLTLELSEPK